MSRKSLDGFMEELKNVTYGTYPRKFCFFLGAGASTTSGIPSGQDLVRQWDAYMKKDNPKGHLRWRAELGITDENMVSFYSEYYDRRFRDFPTDGYAEIERITAAGRPSAGYLLLAQLLTNSPHNVVITTNFDHLTENAVTKFTGRLPLVIGHENLAGYVTGHPSRPTVIKIHRDLLLEPKSATTALQTMDKQWEPALERIFSNYHPVFIGYAGNDKSVMDYLRANAGRFKTDWKKPYWMFYGQEVKSPTVRQFLEESDGIRMFGCGFDEVMVRMGQALDCGLPDLRKIQEQEMEVFREVRRAYLKIAVKPYMPIWNEAEHLRWRGKYTNAAEKYQEFLTRVPEYAMGHLLHGHCLMHLGDDASAELEYREAIRLDPMVADHHHALGELLAKLGRTDDAEAAYRKAIHLEPKESRHYHVLGNLLVKLGRKNEAIAIYRESINFDPMDSWNHHFLGDLLAELGQTDEAVAAYQEAIRLDPKETALYHVLGELLSKSGRTDEAIATYREAICLKPEEGFYHFSLANLLKKAGHKREAEAEYQKAIHLDSDEASYHRAFGNLLVRLGKTSAAESAYRTAIRLDPEDAFSHYCLGTLLVKLGRDDEAETEYRQAIRHSPEERLYYIHLANLLDEHGRKHEATALRAKADALRKPK